MRIIDQIHKFQLDADAPAKPGETYQTANGAEFLVGEDGKVTITKSLGCIGCDMAFPTIDLDGKTAHRINSMDVMYCTKSTSLSTETKN